MFCPNCGADVGTVRYCPDCGTSIERSHREIIEEKIYARVPKAASAPRASSSGLSPMRVRAFIALGSAGVVVIGSLLPWAEVRAVFVGQLSKAGTEGDGVITLVLALVAGLVALLCLGGRRQGNLYPLITGLCGVFIAGVAINDIADVQRVAGDLEKEGEGLAQASVGSGLYVTLIGGIGLILTGLWGFLDPETKGV